MIAAITTLLDEADVIERSINHLLANGIDLILAADASTDGTRDILDRLSAETGKVEWRIDDLPYHDQPYWMNLLANEAHARGAEWVIGWDADEFFYAEDGRTIAETLADVPLSVDVLNCQLWHHRDWEWKYAQPERLPKVACRWLPGMVFAMGQHSVSGGCEAMGGVLSVRHYQYRGFDHFARKVAQRNATLAPAARARGDGNHHLRLEGAGVNELQVAWEELQGQPAVFDPIPLCR